MSEAAMLIEHGTALARLKAVNLLQAALRDLKLRDAKKEDKADPDALYSFARKHVHRAKSPEHLIALAYFDPDAAASTDKHSTLIVYTDRDLLRVTLINLLQGGDLETLRLSQAV